MKLLVLISAIFWLAACRFGSEIQVERVNVELVRVDTIYRDGDSVKIFTWQSPNHLKYTSFEGIKTKFPLGTTMAIFIKR
jgi:hypothetical protein